MTSPLSSIVYGIDQNDVAINNKCNSKISYLTYSLFFSLKAQIHKLNYPKTTPLSNESI